MGELKEDQNQAISSRIAEDETATGYSTEEVNHEMKSQIKPGMASTGLTERDTKEGVLMPQPKTRAKRTVKPVTSGKIDAEELIKTMEAKIEILHSLSAVNWGGGTADSNTPKAIRDVYIGIDKDVEDLKAKWIQVIQSI